MADFGVWEVNVTIGKYPQKVATALGKLGEMIVGAEYEAIAYLGSQVVNGVNHAVLAKQIVTTGRDTENIVVLIFNEKPGDMEATLIGIERIVESGEAFGGTQVSVKTEIPDDVMEVWNDAFDGYVGARVVPFALLGSRVTKGIDHIFAVTFDPAVLEGATKVMLVVVNNVTKSVSFADLLADKFTDSLGYAFNW